MRLDKGIAPVTGIHRAVAHVGAAVNPHHHGTARLAHALGRGPHVQRQAVLALWVERCGIALGTRLDRAVAEVLGLAHQAAVGLGPRHLPATLTRRLQGIGDALERQQATVPLTHKHAVRRLYGQRIGVCPLNHLVHAIQRRHLLLKLRRRLNLRRLLSPTTR